MDYTPTAGTITCTWKDQGWGNWKGKLHLNLLAPDGAHKVTYIVPGVAPHEPEDLEVVLVETDAVLAEATSGCKYQITALVGAGGGHELHLTNLVLRLSGECQLQLCISGSYNSPPMSSPYEMERGPNILISARTGDTFDVTCTSVNYFTLSCESSC